MNYNDNPGLWGYVSTDVPPKGYTRDALFQIFKNNCTNEAIVHDFMAMINLFRVRINSFRTDPLLYMITGENGVDGIRIGAAYSNNHLIHLNSFLIGDIIVMLNKSGTVKAVEQFTFIGTNPFNYTEETAMERMRQIAAADTDNPEGHAQLPVLAPVDGIESTMPKVTHLSNPFGLKH